MLFYATFYIRLHCGWPASPIPKILSIWLVSFFSQWPFPDLSLTLGSPCWSPGIKLNRSLARLLAPDKWCWVQLPFYELEGSFLSRGTELWAAWYPLHFAVRICTSVALQEDHICHWCKKGRKTFAGRKHNLQRCSKHSFYSEVGQLFASR